jgi:phosphatidylglycerol:prolipoprotein diacylglycerol transferase
MCPILFHVGPIKIYGYGLMLALGFITGSYLLVSEFKRRKLDPNIANNITIIALIMGVVGSKMLFLLENWSRFVETPWEMAFNPGGLTYYGGFILAASSIYYYGRKKNIGFLMIGDSVAPSLMIGYGIARVGCHLAGDGDYGFPTSLPWGTDYSKGTFPPSAVFRDFPEIARQYPGGIVPDNTPCHPTPVYEFIICAIMFWFLWRIRKRISPAGKLFMIYLILAGSERLLIEFIRLNERIIFGLSEAQLISIVMIFIGSLGLWKFNSQQAQLKQK